MAKFVQENSKNKKPPNLGKSRKMTIKASIYTWNRLI